MVLLLNKRDEKVLKMVDSTVYLIGAGPGNEGLITVRGLELLRKADVLVYDQLGTSAFLNEVPKNCQMYDVGKSSGNHKLSQDGINELLAEKAKEFKRVVRLKGGDPYIFGRGGEEYLYLKERGINVEVIPGITSAISVPAYAGIPITQRGYTTSLAIITGHEAQKESSDLNWKALAGIGTVVFVMGVKNIGKICQNLINEGKSPNTPVAMIRNGTLPMQKTYIGTLATMEEIVKKENIQPPCVTVVGKVVDLHSELNWFEKLPLYEKNIVVTRSRSQASSLLKELKELGANAIECPTIKITEITENKAFDGFINNHSNYSHLVFTSVNGVELFIKKVLEANKDLRILYGKKIICIGPATAEAFKSRAIIPDYIPETYVAESMIPYFEKESNAKVAILRAEKAREVLPEALKKLGHQVNVIPLYHTDFENSISLEILELLKNNQIDYVTFTSSSTVDGFAKMLENTNIKTECIPAAVIGPVTEETCKKYGFNVVAKAKEYTIQGLVEAIIKR